MERTIDECFFQIQNGANIKQGDANGGFPITRIETTANDKFNRDRMGYAGITDLSKYGSYVLEDGDLLMSHINSVQYLGRTVLYEKQGDETIIHGMNLLRLKARRDIINPAYARYCFYAHPFRSQVTNITKKSVNQASFAVTDLKKIKINVPDIAEQNSVVDKLDRIQGIIEQRNIELVQLDNLIKARFVELFEDGESPLKTVEELCSDIVDCPHTTPKYEGELKNPAIRTSEIKKGYITWDSMRYVSDEEYEERVSRLRPETGDIVYGREGTFGNAAVLPEGYKFCLGQRVMLLRPDYTKCTSEYLLHAVISDDVYRQAVGKNNASTVAHVNVKDVKQFKIPLPSFDKQNQFAAFVKQVDKSKVVVQEALKETQLLFDSLMQKYFG